MTMMAMTLSTKKIHDLWHRGSGPWAGQMWQDGKHVFILENRLRHFPSKER